MRKVLLIGDSPISMSPYILSYIEVFEKHNIPYELIFWNKTLEDVSQLPKEYIPYNYAHDNTMPSWKKIFKIYSFARFAKKHIREKDYAYIVVFTIAHAVFFHPFLEHKYKGRYIFDIRDHSPLCKIGFIRCVIKKLISDSAFTVLSSRGFLRWLPCVEEKKIVISHNITISALERTHSLFCYLSDNQWNGSGGASYNRADKGFYR